MDRSGTSSLAACTLALLLPSALAGQVWLEDVSERLGVDFRHVRADEVRFWLPEIMSGGACWLDYDRDGDPDLYLVQGGSLGSTSSAAWHNELYRNDGEAGFIKVTAAAGADDSGYGMGCAVGDFDGDGWVDLFVTNVGSNVLYRNARDGSFSRRPEGRGVEDDGWGSSAAFLDYDQDGALDLFVVNYVSWSPEKELECFSGGLRDYCHPDRYDAPAPDRLYRNRGDGTFEEATGAAGVDAAFGNGLGVAVADFDGDGLQDIYVANDGMANQLWHNQGDGTFRDVGLLAGVAANRIGAPEAGMGVQAFDADGDSVPDLFVTHLRSETNTLYVNDGSGQFSDRTATSGLGAASLGYTGFGVGFVDFDADGNADLFVANGRIGRGLEPRASDPFAEPDHLYRGLGEGHYELLQPPAIDSRMPLQTSRAAAFADADADGDVDVVVMGNGGQARVLQNRVGTEAAWIAARVLDSVGTDAPGARVSLVADQGRAVRVVQSAYSYCSGSESRVHFGLGEAEELVSMEVSVPGRRRRLVREPPLRAVLIWPSSSE